MNEHRDFLSVADLAPGEVGELVDLSLRAKRDQALDGALEGRIIALLFEKPSLRTRGSFEAGIRQLGGDCVYFSPEDVGLGSREPVADVARVLDRWFDCIVARVFSHGTLLDLAKNASVPVINALSDEEHPCQAMADLLTLRERLGGLRGARLAYIGDGNNVAASLAIACASVGANFTIASPREYRVAAEPWDEAKGRAEQTGSSLRWVSDPRQAVRGADAVYTDVWVSMGDEAEAAERLQAFRGYQVGPELMEAAGCGAAFMHDMPAHEGEEIAAGMLDHPASVVFDQAENRLHAQKAILRELLT